MNCRVTLEWRSTLQGSAKASMEQTAQDAAMVIIIASTKRFCREHPNDLLFNYSSQCYQCPYCVEGDLAHQASR